ncbi:MAG: hypothetical protein ACR2HD_07795 [Solirubrobacteraceae bacterium]|nr:MAG: hypothetical protein DLM63_10555 [Solirubrobacterales bacterium]
MAKTKRSTGTNPRAAAQSEPASAAAPVPESADEVKRHRAVEADASRLHAGHAATRDEARRAVAGRNQKAHEAALIKLAARDKRRREMRTGEY